MQVTYRASQRLTIEFQASDQKDVFKQLGSIDDAHGVRECGVCGGAELRYQAREAKGNNFYELVCKDPECRAKLSFGQMKGSTDIYPRRRYHKEHPLVVEGKAEAEAWMPNGGWERYAGKGLV